MANPIDPDVFERALEKGVDQLVSPRDLSKQLTELQETTNQVLSRLNLIERHLQKIQRHLDSRKNARFGE